MPVDEVDVAVGAEVGEVVDLAPDPVGLAVVLDRGVAVLELRRLDLDATTRSRPSLGRGDDRRPRDGHDQTRLPGRVAERLGLDPLGMQGAERDALVAGRDRPGLDGLEDRRSRCRPAGRP